MIKRATLILTILLVAGLMFSCPLCDGDGFHYSFSHRDIVVQNLDNSGALIKVAEGQAVFKTAYGIRIYIQREDYELCSECRQSRANFGLIETANAVDCFYDNYYDPLEKIVDVRIITLNDFDATHLANSDIADYFKLADSFETIDDFCREYNKDGYIRSGSNPPLIDDIDILLMTPPTMGITHKFRVEMALSDGRTLVNETDEIDLIL